MRRRGPDNQDFWSDKNNGINTYLLHSRLSILDLDKRSNQPYEFNNCILVFNGEIYNYIELRAELKRKGHSFSTNSDTEVLIKSYIEFEVNVLTNSMVCGHLQYGTRERKNYLYQEIDLEKSHFIILAIQMVFFWFRN